MVLPKNGGCDQRGNQNRHSLFIQGEGHHKKKGSIRKIRKGLEDFNHVEFQRKASRGHHSREGKGEDWSHWLSAGVWGRGEKIDGSPPAPAQWAAGHRITL